jgi:hypothetical protein
MFDELNILSSPNVTVNKRRFYINTFCLPVFSEAFLSYFTCKSLIGHRYFMHLLNHEGKFTFDRFVFEPTDANPDLEIGILYRKIYNRLNIKYANCNDLFFIHISRVPLKQLDFDILRFNSGSSNI